MTEDEKQLEACRLLKSAGFVIDHPRGNWFNHDQRQLFTRRVVRDMPLDWLRGRLKVAIPRGEYWFNSHYESGVWESVFANFELSDLRVVPKPIESRPETTPPYCGESRPNRA
jgi:hypothetical protein